MSKARHHHLSISAGIWISNHSPDLGCLGSAYDSFRNNMMKKGSQARLCPNNTFKKSMFGWMILQTLTTSLITQATQPQLPIIGTLQQMVRTIACCMGRPLETKIDRPNNTIVSHIIHISRLQNTVFSSLARLS